MYKWICTVQTSIIQRSTIQGTSLVVQWLRLHMLLMEEIQAQSLVQEQDPIGHNKRVCMLQLKILYAMTKTQCSHICMCIYIYIAMCIHIQLCVYTHTHTHTHTHIYTHTLQVNYTTTWPSPMQQPGKWDPYVSKCACFPTFSSNLSRKLKSVAGPGRIHSSSFKTETEVSGHSTTLHQFQV